MHSGFPAGPSITRASFNEFVSFALAVFGVSRICWVGRSRLVLILGTKIATLRKRTTNAEQQGEAGGTARPLAKALCGIRIA